MEPETRYPIIDVDVHIHEEPSDLVPYATGTLRQALERNPGGEYWLDTPGYSPLTLYDPPIADTPERDIHTVRTPEGLRGDLDSLGVDAAIVFSARFLNTAVRTEPHYPVEVMEAYNRYLHGHWVNPIQGVHAAIMAVPQDPHASAREIKRYAEVAGFVAVYLPMASVHPLWGHRQYDPIFASAAAAGLPVVLHGFTQVHSVFPYQLEHVETALAKQLLSKPFGAMANFASLVTTGVLDRFRDLRVVFAECGVSWLLYMLWRLDRQYEWLRTEVPFYTSKPSEALRSRLYVTTHSLELPHNSDLLFPLLDTLDLHDHTLFGTDWPHYDADSPETIRRLSIPDDWKRKILSDNARRLFRLEHIARRTAAARPATARAHAK